MPPDSDPHAIDAAAGEDPVDPTGAKWRFDRRELAGSLGDLGTLLPLAAGLILINELSATAILITTGAFYVVSGLYFRVTMPVQPMKAIAAYAIARAMSPTEISAAGFCVGVVLLLLAATGGIAWLARVMPKSVVRGVQLATATLLLMGGVRLMAGQSVLQTTHGIAEPFLSVASLGPIPIGWILGSVSVILILALLPNRRAPAALVVVVAGGLVGLALGAHQSLSGVRVGLHLPEVLPYGWPSRADAVVGLLVLALPQLPMTMGNAVLAQADLTREYFGETAAKRASPRALTLSMGLANVIVPFVGGMPLCHGAGGSAAHYRFGARTAGSNLIIGGLLLALGLLFGDRAASLLSVLPLSVLGALLVFSGAQLGLSLLDVRRRADLFVVVVLLGVTLATNLAIGFLVGVLLALLLQRTRLSI